MSIAGIRSNRGDIYQKLVALDWALTVLIDPDYEWLEIDSTSYLVDDVVIGRSDGFQICCQCKKNQSDFQSWSISALADELNKAIQELIKNPNTRICFYSRSNFGDLAKLQEFSTAYRNEADYRANLTQGHKKTDCDLSNHIAKQGISLSSFKFLRRTTFVVTNDFERMQTLLRERLHRAVTNCDASLQALWTCIDKLGGRMEESNPSASTLHRLTKSDLKDILRHAGAMLAPEMSIAQVRSSFASTSFIGRSWVREIAGQRFKNPVVDGLLAAINARKRAVLLTGSPGSGKTCAILSLQEALEQRAQTQRDLVPLFIQSREFADLATPQELQAQGLPEQWVEQAARLAEDEHLIVIIDSLDVLSIAREHSVLKYFLAQIDRLLAIPNVTIITACRDFDRKYDRRIAVRNWDCEFQCLPLDWEAEISPLLAKIGIDPITIDAATRELIRNPRELALFVELAQRESRINAVTSQALAQQFLHTIVLADPTLGDVAMQAIEAAANAMLKSRTLAIPHQRVSASQDILRRLKSLNILQETHDGKLAFGHQTLLDVLVISDAIRHGISLNGFIQGLPQVPFVRPAIRSFVAQLVMGDRREFRKQLRAVLSGNAAFHIRRLVAESFAQQIPHDDDWPMIRDLRNAHRDVYLTIYSQASLIEWHHFWLCHLVPTMKEIHDADGIIAHVHRVTKWINADPNGVLSFWLEALSLSWLEGKRIADQLCFSLSELKQEYLSLAVPLLARLISLPKSEHSFLGRAVARSVAAGAIDDILLWRYIAGDVTEDDVTKHNLNNKLHCQPHVFGDKNENFLKHKMAHSTTLLDLSLEAIEQWSHINSEHFGQTRIGYRHGFLNDTSFEDTHSQTDHQHADEMRILFDAIEAAIDDHVKNNTAWWQRNRERLCFNHEGALCFFAIRAFTNYPQYNLDLISHVLCDRNLLEFELSYELGSLIHAAFIFLENASQDAVMATIQTVWNKPEVDEGSPLWKLKIRAEYISAIPCHLRSVETQAILDSYESLFGTLVRKPFIHIRGGIVAAPFSYEAILGASDESIIRLLTHYSGYKRSIDDFLIGGEREVGCQLREASSRHPSRFLILLTSHWVSIAAPFRNDIMDGISTYLMHRNRNSQTSNSWIPIEDLDARVLANQILDELERHHFHWQLTCTMAKSLEVCANAIQDTQNAGRLVFLAIGFGSLIEESPCDSNSVDLLTAGINMKVGMVAEALMILANNFHEREIELPELLVPTLRHFARNENPSIRALILRHLPYLQSKNPELGWELFELAMQDAAGLWQSAERCLYYAYHDHFERIAPLLKRILQKGRKADMETWGRISALCALTGHIIFGDFLVELNSLNIMEAWQGAASVWSHIGNIRQHPDLCYAGIKVGLNTESPYAMTVAQCVTNIFRENTAPVAIPTELIQLYFAVLESQGEDKDNHLFGFDKWLNATSERAPEIALSAAEAYLAYVNHSKPFFYDHDNQLVQLITRLFAEAEEREEFDNGEMLKRVVSVQDMMLSLGVNSMNDWLKAAERQ